MRPSTSAHYSHAQPTGVVIAAVGRTSPRQGLLADPLRPAVFLACVACILGALLVAREPAPIVVHHAIPRPSKVQPARLAPALPRLQQIDGIIQYVDIDTGSLVVRTAGGIYGLQIGAASVFTTPCVAPTALKLGQHVRITVNAYLNGVLNTMQIAPDSSVSAAVCGLR